MNNQENYERYGEEWKKSVLKMSKIHMLEMIERICKERDSLKFRLSVILSAENQEPDYEADRTSKMAVLGITEQDIAETAPDEPIFK